MSVYKEFLEVVIHFVDGEDSACGANDISPNFEISFSSWNSSIFVLMEVIFYIASMDAGEWELMLDLKFVEEDFESIATKLRNRAKIIFE